VQLSEKSCQPMKPDQVLSLNEEADLIQQIRSWVLNRTGVHSISKKFAFPGFMESIEFIGKVADLAESENHHPDIHIYYNRVEIVLRTHLVNGLSENDFILAAKIDLID
jgi:4a-hydroxytetrahydrobiopterin dehydratase